MSTDKTTGKLGREFSEVTANAVSDQSNGVDAVSEEVIQEGALRINPYRITITPREFWIYVWEGLTLKYLRSEHNPAALVYRHSLPQQTVQIMSTDKTTAKPERELSGVTANAVNGQSNAVDAVSEEVIQEIQEGALRIRPERTTITPKEFWIYVWEGLTLKYLRELPEVTANAVNDQNNGVDTVSEEVIQEKQEGALRIRPERTTITPREFWIYVWEGLTLKYLRE